MSTKNDKSNTEDVLEKEDQTKVKEVELNGEDVGDLALASMFEAETPDESKKDEGESDKEAEEEKPKSGKSDEEESDEEDDEKSSEPFARVGTTNFDTKEDLLKWAGSTVGYNTWLTGQLRKLHPEFFNDDGSIKSADLEKSISSSSKKVEEAAETVRDLAGVKPEDMDAEQKEDYERARKILKPLGVVFWDDSELKELKESSKKIREQELERARADVDAFEKEHPAAQPHFQGLAKLMNERNYSLKKAWQVYKVENDIEEQESKKSEDGKGNEAVDTTLPTTIKKGSGAPPSSGKGDFFDEIIGATGF